MFNTDDDFYKPEVSQARFMKNITIHEHRAPTDDSIRIYNEILDKAKTQIVDQVAIKDNLINGAVIYFQSQTAMDYREYYIKFSINGKEQVFTGKYHPHDIPFDRKMAEDFIVKHIALTITQSLLGTIKHHGPTAR